PLAPAAPLQTAVPRAETRPPPPRPPSSAPRGRLSPLPRASGTQAPARRSRASHRLPRAFIASEEEDEQPCPACFNTWGRGQVALGGGYLHWGHFEMMRLTIGRCMDPKTMFAVWRVPAPSKPVTRKSLGHRMGGGKGPIDHYVTAVKSGRLLVEVGGRCEFGEVKAFLTQVARKLPFPAAAVSRDTLQRMREEEEEKRLHNQNPWTFERIVTANMLGMRKYLSPYDLKFKGRYWGKFFLKHRV
uniref:Large ribosomal subunit protein uL16m n=1 Tax=Apteryx owenii TaxID=8824 RepID=A0A8B9Q0K4_APTOW